MFIYSFYALSNALLMFLLNVPLLMLSSHKVSSLYNYIVIVNSSPVNNNETKHAFLRAYGMDKRLTNYVPYVSVRAWL